MSSEFRVEAYNLYDSLHIKAIRPIVSGKILDSTPAELQIQYGDNSYGFIYRFGCVVFFNVEREKREAEITKLKSAIGKTIERPTYESFVVRAPEPVNNVEFEYVELKKLTLDQIRIICVTVGQSAALEYFEVESDRTLSDSAAFMNSLAISGGVPFRKMKHLHQIIGRTARARQHIMSNLAILDPPDETWKSKELELLFRELQGNFDVDTRFRTLDRKLTLAQDNIEILSDLSSKQRGTLLEMLIATLIVIELAVALLFRH